MSIDLRPAFPLDFNSPFLLLGAAAYLALLVASVWLVLRRRDLWGLAGVLLFFLLISYVISFYTVWIQEPFVLYRSYLWAIAIPGLVALVLMRLTPRVIYSLGLVLGIVFGGLALERIMVMKIQARHGRMPWKKSILLVRRTWWGAAEHFESWYIPG